MTSREWLTLALRVLGFWISVSAVASMTMLVAAAGNGSGFPGDQLLVVGTQVLGYGTMACVLLLYAPALASWFESRPAPAPVGPPSTPRIADVYQIAARVLGVYAVFGAIRPLGGLVHSLRDAWIGRADWNWAYTVEVAAYLGCAALLIVRSDTIAALFARSHLPKPNTDPWSGRSE